MVFGQERMARRCEAPQALRPVQKHWAVRKPWEAAGRLVSALEGGYDPDAAAHAGAAHIGALLQR